MSPTTAGSGLDENLVKIVNAVPSHQLLVDGNGAQDGRVGRPPLSCLGSTQPQAGVSLLCLNFDFDSNSANFSFYRNRPSGRKVLGKIIFHKICRGC